jgi:hypothetical protein
VANEFDLYKLLVEEVREARKARRDLSNMFMTMNLGGIGALSFLADPTNPQFQPLLGWAAFALIMVCWIWRTSNRYYTLMLAAKYNVLYELEDAAIPQRPIQREYEIMRPNRAMRQFSLERALPTLFILGYVAFIIYANQAAAMALFERAMAFIAAAKH